MTKAFSFPARAWITVILLCSNVSAVIGATHLIQVHTCTVFWMCFIILGIIIFLFYYVILLSHVFLLKETLLLPEVCLY